MKNVRFEFTDADYELVTKAYKQYEKLAKDYYHKEFLFWLFALVTIPVGFLVFSLAQRIINARFVGLINLIIIICTIILYVLFSGQSVIYSVKMNLTEKYKADCLDIKNNMEEAKKTSGRLEFGTDITYDGIIETNKLFYRIRKTTFAIRRYPVIENKIPYTDNIVLRLKKNTDKYDFVSYVWQAESA